MTKSAFDTTEDSRSDRGPYAEMLDDTEGARSLQNTLSEETETDQKLAGVAKSVIKAIFS